MVSKQDKCGECGYYPDRQTDYCPECGEKDPWIEESVYQFNPDNDLPLILSYYVTDYSSPLYKSFCEELFGEQRIITADEIDGPIENLPRMGELHEEIFYVLTDDYTIEGPFYSENEALNSDHYSS